MILWLISPEILGISRWVPDVKGEKILITYAAAGYRTRAVRVTGQHSTASL